VLLLDTLSNAGGGTTWTGTLDLGGNDLMLHSTASTTVSVLSSISQQLQAGYNGGLWNGKGISSSAAASDTRHLTAIGMMPNGSDSAFDNQTATTTDILLKHTYYGDANLDGKVDGSDYSRIDSGYLTKATGWFNGDFNYDGTINESDYTLIDNAFNTQGAVLAATIAPAADPAAELAVPLKTFSPSPAIFSTNSAGLFSSLPLIQRSIQAMKSPAGQWSTDRNGRVPNILCTWPGADRLKLCREGLEGGCLVIEPRNLRRRFFNRERDLVIAVDMLQRADRQLISGLTDAELCCGGTGNCC